MKDTTLGSIGVFLIAAGLGFVYWPVAIIFVGAVLFAAAVLWVD